MNEINQAELLATVNRIKTSLNKRYEKDAELYISYQDTLRIKHHLFKREYEAIENLVQAHSISPTVVARVTVKNLWLLDDFSKKDKNSLNAILDQCDTSTLRTVVDGINENTVEMSFELKDTINRIYYGKAPLEECLYYLNEVDKRNTDVLKICFKRVVTLTDDPQQKMNYIKEFLSKHISLSYSKNILVGIVESLSGDERNSFGSLLEREIVSYLCTDKEVPKTIENALFAYPDNPSRVGRILHRVFSNTYIPKDRMQVGCRFMRDFLKDLPSEEANNGIDVIMGLYDELPERMQSIVEKNVFAYKAYGSKLRTVLDERLDDDGIEIEENKGSDTIDSAEDVYRFVNVDHRYSGPKWYDYAVCACLFKIRGKKKGPILIDFLKKYADSGDQYCAFYYPKLFEEFARKVYDSEPAISELITFLHDLKDGKYDNDETWPVDETKDLTCEILDRFVNVIVERRLTQGGIHGALYNYLYDYRREDCELLFDI